MDRPVVERATVIRKIANVLSGPWAQARLQWRAARSVTGPAKASTLPCGLWMLVVAKGA